MTLPVVFQSPDGRKKKEEYWAAGVGYGHNKRPGKLPSHTKSWFHRKTYLILSVNSSALFIIGFGERGPRANRVQKAVRRFVGDKT